MALPPAEIQWQMEHIHQDTAPAGIAVISVFGFIALVTFIWRLAVRIRGVGLGLDDYLIMGGAVFTFLQVLSVYELCHWGTGKHIIAIPPQNVEPLRKWVVVSYFTFPAAIALVKWSILAQIARIFTTDDPIIRFGVWGISIYTFLWLLGQYLAIGLSCHPFSSLWTTEKPCSLPHDVTLVPTIFDIIGDFAIVLLPQHVIWRLKMTWGKRLAVSFVMALGIFCSITGIIRIVETKTINPFDVTYDTVPLIFACLEPIVGVICACLPCAQATIFGALLAAKDGFLYLSNLSASRFSGSDRGSRRTNSLEKNHSPQGSDKNRRRYLSPYDIEETQPESYTSLQQVQKHTTFEITEEGRSTSSQRSHAA